MEEDEKILTGYYGPQLQGCNLAGERDGSHYA